MKCFKQLENEGVHGLYMVFPLFSSVSTTISVQMWLNPNCTWITRQLIQAQVSL